MLTEVKTFLPLLKKSNDELGEKQKELMTVGKRLVDFDLDIPNADSGDESDSDSEKTELNTKEQKSSVEMVRAEMG